MNQFQKIVKKNRIYVEYVNLLAPLLNLTERQLQVLAYIVELATQCDNYDILNTDNRRIIINECHINKHNLSRFVKIYRNKRILHSIDRITYSVNPSLLPIIKDNIIQISYIINIDEIQ